jgi:glycosyltransferase involved in cell wall biosynthesis
MGRSRSELLFVARRPPFPLTNGARIRTNRLLTGLATEFPTTLLTFEHDPGSPDGHMGANELAELFPDVRIVTVPGRGPGKRLPQARSLASSRSWEFGRYRLPQLGAALQQCMEADQPSIVHFDDLAVAQFAPVSNAINVYSAHNVERRILEGNMRTSNLLRRVFARVERGKVQREELEAWRAASLCLAVSELDAGEMRAAGARVALCPNGADPVQQLGLPRRDPTEPLRLLFVGSVSYLPNHRGLTWFVEDVLPLLRQSVPATLDVVGAPAAKMPAAPGVIVRGTVCSLVPFYERCHAAIVPVVYGSGTRLKVVEAMAFGRPVVSTSVGAEGLPVVGGDHYLEANEPAAFAGALATVAAQCASGDERLARMIRRAREAVAPLFWPQIVSRLVETYREELRARELVRPRVTAGGRGGGEASARRR